MKRLLVGIASFLCLVFFVTGCDTIPKDALVLKETSLQDRKLQSRKFQTSDEIKVLTACSGLLQDLGFNLSESETKLGVLVAYKDRSAVEGGQVAAKIIVALLGGGNVPIDKNQRLKASVITKPSLENTNEIVVRVTFQRVVYNELNQITKLEQLKDPKQYQEFFNALSKSLFITANDI